MEPSRFDELTKALATSTSRRQAIKTIAATTLGGMLALSGIGPAFAKCKGSGSKCHHAKQCCGTMSGCCGGTCTDLSSDRNNCGSCGKVCPPTQVCSGGQCGCPPGRTKLCNGTCVISSCASSGCPNGCTCTQDEAAGNYYCANLSGGGSTCTSDCDCPSGQFCINGLPTGFCATAC